MSGETEGESGRGVVGEDALSSEPEEGSGEGVRLSLAESSPVPGRSPGAEVSPWHPARISRQRIKESKRAVYFFISEPCAFRLKSSFSENLTVGAAPFFKRTQIYRISKGYFLRIVSAMAPAIFSYHSSVKAALASFSLVKKQVSTRTDGIFPVPFSIANSGFE